MSDDTSKQCCMSNADSDYSSLVRDKQKTSKRSTQSLKPSTLQEYQNPASLVTLQFTNRGEKILNNISLFKNLVDVDLTGNELTECIEELSSLQYLKKLNLSNNSIEHMWKLPAQIEHLIMNFNKLTELGPFVFDLPNLTVLEVTNNFLKNLNSFQPHKKIALLNLDFNQIEHIEGIQQFPALSLCSLQSNQIEDIKEISFFTPLQMLNMINLKCNPILEYIPN